MINGRKVIAIIPARGGSKGLPGKNIRPICGKPLIGWTIEKAKNSRFVDKLLVSTDSEEIADVADKFGAKVPFLRPANLATDTSTTFEAVQHALNYLSERGEKFDYVMLLEPTSPLREDDDIDQILNRLDNYRDKFDSIVSLGEIATEHPSIAKRFSSDLVVPYASQLTLTTRRQDNEPAYFPYGVGYAAKVDSYLSEKTFYTERCTGFFIKRYQNYEIDDIYDFLCVESVMKHQWNIK